MNLDELKKVNYARFRVSDNAYLSKDCFDKRHLEENKRQIMFDKDFCFVSGSMLVGNL